MRDIKTKVNTEMKKIVRIIVVVTASLAVLILVASIIGGNILLKTALLPEDNETNYAEEISKLEPGDTSIKGWYRDLHDSGVFVDTLITNERGFVQHAVYASAPDSARGTAVLVHGYTDCIISMMNIARMYRDSLNFNLLVFDQEFHGQSEGEAIRMGWIDRLNAAMWTEVAHNLWKDSFMVVHGVSMGAATVMMLSGDPDPEWVGAYIEDCGYTSVWDEYKKELKERYGLPPFPMLHVASIMCDMKYGWNFKEASSVNQLAKSTKPVLFIHGDNDTYVPTSDIYKNYEAKTQGLKKMWLSEGAAHARAFKQNPAEYTAVVRDFINEVKNNE